MGRIEADIVLESWLFGFWPCSGQGQFTLCVCNVYVCVGGGGRVEVQPCTDPRGLLLHEEFMIIIIYSYVIRKTTAFHDKCQHTYNSFGHITKHSYTALMSLWA